jgi:metal-sulfur cluster biosynthetic enzyme
MHALRAVRDPRLGMSNVGWGWLRCHRQGGAVTVTMTLTLPGCPIHGDPAVGE